MYENSFYSFILFLLYLQALFVSFFGSQLIRISNNIFLLLIFFKKTFKVS